MPVYDYRCSECGQFEAWRSIADLHLPIHCPTCQTPAQRLFSPPNVVLNGSFSLQRPEKREPRLEKRERQPQTPKNQEHKGGRPWMLGHASPTY
ncbi:MAG: zinc ribbon domain-containing protein [Synechococcaceae cyanobacterium SM2_3_1]|nr:zinc ribbon domain-containing protein [Synechococcaceae cyanobacterium SM2_3_1]